MSASVIVTGCSSGIGKSTALLLAKHGWHVFATVRKTTDAAELAFPGIHPITLDVDDTGSLQNAVATVHSATGGRLDALVNNAGIAIPGAVEDLSRAALRAQFETNLFGVIELTNMLLPMMRANGHGRIVMISSILGLVAMPWRGAYNASKFALEGITDTLRMELAGSGIHVSLIEPGPVASHFRDNALLNFDAHVGTADSPHAGVYARMRRQTGAAKNRSRFTLPPEAVAAKILQALEAKNPKAHYLVTVPAHTLALFRRLLPTTLLDRILRRI